MINFFLSDAGLSGWGATSCWTLGLPTQKPPLTPPCFSSSCSPCRSFPWPWIISSRYFITPPRSDYTRDGHTRSFNVSLSFQNNTAKLVKHLSKSGETEGKSGCLINQSACSVSFWVKIDSFCVFFPELRKLALVLVEGWMAIIRSQSVSSGASPNGRSSRLHHNLHLDLLWTT